MAGERDPGKKHSVRKKSYLRGNKPGMAPNMAVINLSRREAEC